LTLTGVAPAPRHAAWARHLAALILCLAAATMDGGAAEPPREYQVKAAFLYNFAKFVQWPQDGPTAGGPRTFAITIVGQDPFGPSLEETLQGKTIDGQKIVIRRAATAAEMEASQIVFISGSEKGQMPDILRRLEGAATLTVAETDHFAERGGIIRFRMDGDRVRLDINPTAAERARLKISSELLKLARIVGPAPRGGRGR
jgi:hypothetical protein